MNKSWATGALCVAVVAALLGILMWNVGDAEPVEGIVVAANVMVAGVTFLAAIAALRSAASAELISRRATEALARTLRPTMAVDTFVDSRVPNAPLVGRLLPMDGPSPIDVRSTWHLSEGRVVTGLADRVERWRPDLP